MKMKRIRASATAIALALAMLLLAACEMVPSEGTDTEGGTAHTPTESFTAEPADRPDDTEPEGKTEEETVEEGTAKTEDTEPETEAETAVTDPTSPLYVDPSYAAQKHEAVRILAWNNDPDLILDGKNDTLSAAMVERNKALAEIWGCEPTLCSAQDPANNLKTAMLGGLDDFDLCLFPLINALAAAKDGFVRDLDGLGLGLGTDVWDQGVNALTIKGKTRIAAPAVSIRTNDYTFAVLYDSRADGGAMKDRVEALSDGWTWEQMMALVTEAEGLDPDGNGTKTSGMGWEERALSAFILSADFRMTTESLDLVEDYMVPIVEYTLDKPVWFCTYSDPAMLLPDQHVFSVAWMKRLYEEGAGEAVTVLPMPKRAAEQTQSYTTSFNASTLLITGTVDEDRLSTCAAAMYVWADTTCKMLREPYLNQLIPETNAVSRRNAESLFASRVYDYVLHGEYGTTTGLDDRSLKDPGSLIVRFKSIPHQLKRIINRWENDSGTKE